MLLKPKFMGNMEPNRPILPLICLVCDIVMYSGSCNYLCSGRSVPSADRCVPSRRRCRSAVSGSSCRPSWP